MQCQPWNRLLGNFFLPWFTLLFVADGHQNFTYNDGQDGCATDDVGHVEDGVGHLKFGCGGELGTGIAHGRGSGSQQPSDRAPRPTPPPDNRKKSNKGVWIGAACAVVLLISGTVLLVSNLNKKDSQQQTVTEQEAQSSRADLQTEETTAETVKETPKRTYEEDYQLFVISHRFRTFHGVTDMAFKIML